MKANKNMNMPLFAEERRAQILDLLTQNAKILVQDLCQIFSVSSATIRSDLSILEDQGRLKRTHGGAIPTIKTGFEPTTASKLVENIDKKHRIAKYAAKLVEEGDIIALDSGSTTFELAKELCKISGLTIVTYDVNVATYIDTNSENTVYLVGGVLRKGFNCTTGAIALSALKSFNVDKAFMATNGFSFGKGFTTPNSELAECKKVMLAIANRNYMLMDSSKMERVSFLKFAEMRDIDRFIIDSGANGIDIEYINENFPGIVVNLV